MNRKIAFLHDTCLHHSLSRILTLGDDSERSPFSSFQGSQQNPASSMLKLRHWIDRSAKQINYDIDNAIDKTYENTGVS